MNLAEMLAMADQATHGVEVNNTEFELLEPGKYDVQVTNASGPVATSSVNPLNQNEHGQMIKIELTVTGPKHAGRRLWMNNNIICYPRGTDAESKRKAQVGMAIGAKERKVMLDSLGKTGIEHAAELIGASFSANVVVEKGTNGYKDKNVVKSIIPLVGASITSTTVKIAQTPSVSAPVARPKMPWEK